MAAGLGVTVNDAVGARLVTVTVLVWVAVAPLSSVTRTLTSTLPGVVYVRLVVFVVPVSVSNEPLPSRSHSYLAIVPSGSLDAVASKAIAWPVGAEAGVAVKEAVGAWLSTVTVCVWSSVAP